MNVIRRYSTARRTLSVGCGCRIRLGRPYPPLRHPVVKPHGGYCRAPWRRLFGERMRCAPNSPAHDEERILQHATGLRSASSPRQPAWSEARGPLGAVVGLNVGGCRIPAASRGGTAITIRHIGTPRFHQAARPSGRVLCRKLRLSGDRSYIKLLLGWTSDSRQFHSFSAPRAAFGRRVRRTHAARSRRIGVIPLAPRSDRPVPSGQDTHASCSLLWSETTLGSIQVEEMGTSPIAHGPGKWVPCM